MMGFEIKPASVVIAKPKDYACPRCGAKPGDPCKTPSGRKTPSSHGERYREWSKNRKDA